MRAVDNDAKKESDRAVLQHSISGGSGRPPSKPPRPRTVQVRVPRSSGDGTVLANVPHPNGEAARTTESYPYGEDVQEHFNKLAGELADVPAWQHSGGCYWSANELRKTLPAGMYRATERPNVGIVLKEMTVDTDELMELPDSPSQAVLEEVKRFWKLKAEFAARGFIHKRGVMLWGPPGSGKTATVNQLISLVVRQYQGIGFFVDHALTAQHCLRMVRSIEPDRPIVGLIEDLDALVAADREAENAYLALLDGEAQVSNIVFVATTNYPERLDRRFTDRPSRFDLIKQIGMPSAASRRVYLRTKEPSLTDSELNTWVERTEGLSIAHLRELIILARCYGKSLDEALARLFSMRNELPNSERADDGIKRAVGFLG